MAHLSNDSPLFHPLRPIRAAALILVLAILACNAPGLAPTPSPAPTSTPIPTPTHTPEPADTGWILLEPGVQLRQVQVATGDVAERLLLIRLDPADFRFRVLYTPGTARRVSQWATEAMDASPLVVVNGGYFTPEHQSVGLVVSDRQVYGVPYGDFAGMFAVLPGGRVQVRWLAAQPYDPGEMLLEAVQSFPVLVRPGGALGFPADADDGRPARRTVVAQDQEGCILFIVATRGYLALHELARWLVESDLDLDTALNLDGGQSTGLYVSAGHPRIEVDSLVPVPSVIVVQRRE
ncbi:MAG TPA: phosphodiester glycosidase family protein [Chloroflexi bacterium]|nr:phosphodiester glycosidase family protein [Chloroflexota bacterium]